MKKYALCFTIGVITTLGFAMHLGPDTLITIGAKWQAAQRSYNVYVEPMRVLDESLVAEYSAPAPKPAPKKIAKK